MKYTDSVGVVTAIKLLSSIKALLQAGTHTESILNACDLLDNAIKLLQRNLE